MAMHLLLSASIAWMAPMAAPISRAGSPTMGLFDQLKKAFDNAEYGKPAMCVQPQPRATRANSTTFCGKPARTPLLRTDIEAGKLDFSEAAMRFSTCNSASQGEARSARSLAHACCSLLASTLKRGIARWSTCVRLVPDLSVPLPDIPVSFRWSARQVHPGADGAGV
eukprot:scaffold7099_cov131-Isochrysis_galbana.AAC.21